MAKPLDVTGAVTIVNLTVAKAPIGAENAVASITTADGTVLYFTTLEEAIEALGDNVIGTIKLTANYKAQGMGVIAIPEGTTVDLNGYTLEATYVIAFHGAFVIDTSAAGTGLLKVSKSDRAILENEVTYTNGINTELNKQIPVWDPAQGGYIFVDYQIAKGAGFITGEDGNKKLAFEYVVAIEEIARQMFLDGAEDNALEFVIRIEWTVGDNTYHEDVHFGKEEVIASFSDLNYKTTFRVSVGNYADFAKLTFKGMIMSGTQVVVETPESVYNNPNANAMNPAA